MKEMSKVSDECDCIVDGGRKTGGARPKVEARQNDRRMRGEERGTRWKKEQWKRLQRREKEMLDCLRLLCLAQWPSGRRDDGHMNQRLSIWNMAKKHLSIVSCKSCTLPRERDAQRKTEWKKEEMKYTDDPDDKTEQIKTHHHKLMDEEEKKGGESCKWKEEESEDRQGGTGGEER